VLHARVVQQIADLEIVGAVENKIDAIDERLDV